MIRVYLEKPKSWAVEIATFVSEEAYMVVLPSLEAWAKSMDEGYEITESVEDQS